MYIPSAPRAAREGLQLVLAHKLAHGLGEARHAEEGVVASGRAEGLLGGGTQQLPVQAMHGTTQHGVIVAQPGIFEAQSFPGDNALGLASSQLGGKGSDATSRVRCLVKGVLLHLAELRFE